MGSGTRYLRARCIVSESLRYSPPRWMCREPDVTAPVDNCGLSEYRGAGHVSREQHPLGNVLLRHASYEPISLRNLTSIWMLAVAWNADIWETELEAK
jgi:hypothetical protein